MRQRRIWLVALLLLSASLAPTVVTGQPEVAAVDEIFQVAPDPRLCPSPMCGGAWVSEVNRRLTVCADGQEREVCYVAAVVGRGQPPGVAPMLARGHVEPWTYEWFGNLGALVTSARWPAATGAPPSGAFYHVRDNGIRCFTHPCFSYDAALLNLGDRTTVSDVDLSKVGATPEQLVMAQQALAGRGLLLAGNIEPQPNAGPAGEGRLLVATQFYLSPVPVLERAPGPAIRTRPTPIPTASVR